MRLWYQLRCWTFPLWRSIDPTGGDPWLGGPVQIEVCAYCGMQKGWHR